MVELKTEQTSKMAVIRFNLVLMALLLASAAPCTAVAADPSPVGGWHDGPVFPFVPSLSDEFEGNLIDANKWQNTASWWSSVFLAENTQVLGGYAQLTTRVHPTLDITRPMIAVGAVGIARSAMELAGRYALKRVQFGVPIGRHQAVQFMLADMAKDIEAARLLIYKAAWLADQGIRNSKEASMAKAFAADMAMRVTTDAVQIYGGMGYTRWHPVEKLMRDAKVIQIYEGSAQVMRIIIARHLLQEIEKMSS